MSAKPQEISLSHTHLLGQQNSLVSLDSYAFPTQEKSVTLSAATTRNKMAAMKLQASEGDGDEDALSPV